MCNNLIFVFANRTEHTLWWSCLIRYFSYSKIHFPHKKKHSSFTLLSLPQYSHTLSRNSIAKEHVAVLGKRCPSQRVKHTPLAR